VGLSTGICADSPQIGSENRTLAKSDRAIEKVPRPDTFGHSWHQQKEAGEDRDNSRRAGRRSPDLARAKTSTEKKVCGDGRISNLFLFQTFNHCLGILLEILCIQETDISLGNGLFWKKGSFTEVTQLIPELADQNLKLFLDFI
jgi:hypothetical protein